MFNEKDLIVIDNKTFVDVNVANDKIKELMNELTIYKAQVNSVTSLLFDVRDENINLRLELKRKNNDEGIAY